ncbi:MAG: FtsH protease activity modulator HflK [Desulfobacterales bacterium]|nr:MAG: FtsH protease activity modulator HflK [Desulfobacterales bacterium]
MELKDETREMQNDVKKLCAEETADDIPENPGRSWIKWIAGIFQSTFLLFKNFVIKVKNALIKIFKNEDEVGLIDDIKGAFRHIPLRKKGVGVLLAGLVLSVYLLSGVYTVKPGEVAVSTIFGKEVRLAITEGLHYRLPWPFEAIEKVNVSEIRRIDVGVTGPEDTLLFPKKGLSELVPKTGGHAGHGEHGSPSDTSKATASIAPSAKNQYFTGDENILEIRMNIQYQIKDASDYLFSMNSPDSLVPTVARAAVTEFFGQMPVEDLLTVAKSQIQKRIAQRAQNMLDGYGAGLYIVHVNLQEVNPPKEVAQAFRDVASAKEEREERINKAQGYWNTVIPEARGNAHKLTTNAEGYREEIINQAGGDAEKFSAMLDEYRKAKTVTEYRLYLETIEKILAKAKKFVVDSKKERVNLKFVK